MDEQSDEELRIEGWQPVAAGQTAPEWTGDLSDDSTAMWAGLRLRAERMDGAVWWWSVIDIRTGMEIDSSNKDDLRCVSGDAARAAAEKAARMFLGAE